MRRPKPFCGKELAGIQSHIRCTLPHGHEGMCGLVDYRSFRWIDRKLSNTEMAELTSGTLEPDEVKR